MVSGLSSTVNYNYDIANRLTDVGGVPYVYDANGNLLDDGQNEYVYDSANRLISVSGQSTVSSYQYNGLGDRLSQTVDGTVTNYTLDLNTGLTQVLADGTNVYTYGLGRISQSSIVNQQSEIAYFLGDALGSVRQLTNTAGEVTLAKLYSPYGVVTQVSGEGQSAYGYTGESQDAASGMVYLRSRFYNAADGRFQSRDTWAGNYSLPITLNRWSYAHDNPVKFTDPSGHDPWWCGDDPHNPAGCYAQWIYEQAYAHNKAIGLITCPPPPMPGTQVYEDILITHYTFALETDPYFRRFDNGSYDAYIPMLENGSINRNHQYNNGFVYGAPCPSCQSGFNFGVYQEGTGITKDGKYISNASDDIRTNDGIDDGKHVFVYGEGGSCGVHQVAWHTVAAKHKKGEEIKFPCFSKVFIDTYPGIIFTVTDTGSDVGENHLDVFVGPMNVDEFNDRFSAPGSTHFKTKVTRIG